MGRMAALSMYKLSEFCKFQCLLLFFILGHSGFTNMKMYSERDLHFYKERVAAMFTHGYENYINNAYPYDELRPLSCDGVDTWGSFSLSLVDTLDTLIVMGNYSEFQKVAEEVIRTSDFNMNINVSVFETNIRVVGGLLSAHLLSYKSGMPLKPGWPCRGPLLDLAEKVARQLLPAFNTPTGMPYGTVNLRYGVPPGETPITCTAGVATFTVEFGTLSRLTGDPVFENTALNAVKALWKSRSPLGLLGNHINVLDAKWSAVDAGIGAGVDSYLEYLVKGAALLQNPRLIKMFNEYKKLINKHMKRDDWFVWVSMTSGHVTMPVFQSLEAFWPGLLTLVGDMGQAQATLYNYHQVLRQYGFPPESYDIPRGRANQKREGNPLRPELIESIMYLYQATRDPFLIQMGVDILESIEHSARTDCGYATVKNVRDHKIEDRMESFFLAETIKYLYLLFDTSSFIHNNGASGREIDMGGKSCIIGAGGYVFNTEAHPIDIAALDCCSKQQEAEEELMLVFKKSLSLFAVLDSIDSPQFTMHRPRFSSARYNNQILGDRYYDFTWDEEAFESVFEQNFTFSVSDSLDNITTADNSTVEPSVSNQSVEHVELPDVIAMNADVEINPESEDLSAHNGSVPTSDSVLENSDNTVISNSTVDVPCVDGLGNSEQTFNISEASYSELKCPAQLFISRFLIMGQVSTPSD